MKKITRIALACALSIGVAAPALAEAELSYNVGALSSNSSTTEEDFKPALTFGADYAFGNGFYASNANTTGDYGDSDVEITLTVGYGNELANGLSYDLSASRYIYPGDSGSDANDTTLVLGYADFRAEYTKGFSDTKFTDGYTLGLGYTWNISDVLNVDVLVETSDEFDNTASTVTVNYDFGNGLSSFAEFTEADPKAVIGVSQSF
jgi:uncharacterized protein (TIGR02001 family)